jgi:hypothetical protein
MPNSSIASSDTSLNYGWMGTIASFLAESPTDWLTTLSDAYQTLYYQRPTATQCQAWIDCGEVLRSQFPLLVGSRPNSAQWTLIFEYELPREGGRRPDLVLLGAGQILVFEFKQKRSPNLADLDQVAEYGRNLAEYHSGSTQNPVSAILVPTRRTTESSPFQSIKIKQATDLISSIATQILAPHQIADYLIELPERQPAIDPGAWICAEYAPLPSMIQAAQRLFQQEPLPHIKRAHSAGIPALIAYLNQVVEQAARNHERHLFLITGVPGAGKTLVGLQFVYQTHFTESGTLEELRSQDRQAVFLSGNAPLVTVLQYALKSRVFVQAVRNFYIDHEVRTQKAPREQILVFDEAQRAWDMERMSEKYGIHSAAAGTMIRIAERSPNWCVLVGLIGEGQKIHVGEEDGMEQWNTGLQQASSSWYVHCSPEQANYFTAIDSSRLHTDEQFNLSTSLRSHLAKDVQTWVANVLAGDFTTAAKVMPLLRSAGFDAYLTRDLELAKSYCRDRYQTQSQKRYGLLASSRARNLPKYGVANDFKTTQRLKVGAWYVDPPESEFSCCQLAYVATEFSSQGLELDLPIVCWGNDLIWQETGWVTTTRQRHVKNPLQLRLNSYRVLLTRGRDGVLIYLPPDPMMNSTYEVLKTAGLEELSDSSG